jgi:hypothetical protein
MASPCLQHTLPHPGIELLLCHAAAVVGDADEPPCARGSGSGDNEGDLYAARARRVVLGGPKRVVHKLRKRVDKGVAALERGVGRCWPCFLGGSNEPTREL